MKYRNPCKLMELHASVWNSLYGTHADIKITAGTIECHESVEDTWTIVGDMPSPHYGISVVSLTIKFDIETMIIVMVT